jgi:hypothetical protein
MAISHGIDDGRYKETEHEDWTQRARLFMNRGRYRDPCEDYVRGILQSLDAEAA